MKIQPRSIIFVTSAIVLIALSFALWHYTAFFSFYGSGDVKIIKNISYVEGSSQSKQQLDLYLPTDTKNFPMVHFIHGGYWHSGDRNYYEEITGLYASIGLALAERGVGTVVQSYRLVPDVTFQEQIDDVSTAVAWTVKHSTEYGGNGDIFVMGHSAGGHITALLAGDQSYLRLKGVNQNSIKGFIPMSGILDVADMVAKNDAAFNQEISYQVFGEDSKNWKKYSAATYFRRGMTPFLFLSGQNDFPYISAQNEKGFERLNALGSDVTSFVAPSYTHMDMVVRFGRVDDRLVKYVLNFVQKHSGK